MEGRFKNACVFVSERDGRRCRSSSLLFVGEAVLFAESVRSAYKRIVNEMGMVFGRRKM